MRRTKSAAVVVAAGLLAAACSSSHKPTTSTSSPASSTPSTTTSSSAPTSGGPSSPAGSPTTASYKPGGTITISNEQGGTWPCNFNPFTNNAEAAGFVYEPLVYTNPLQNGKTTPLLATGYTWSSDNKSVTFDIRQGVKWSDGQAFSADDVVFTYTTMKNNDATDVYALWPHSGSQGAGLQSVTKDSTGTKVTFTFAAPAQTYFYNLATLVTIVPQHIWSTGDFAAKPDTTTNPNPIGTGPFVMSKCTPNNIEYTANPTYWAPGEPHIQKVEYPAYLDNDTANRDLASGKANWGGQYIPGIKAFYESKSPNNHGDWNPGDTQVALWPNLDPSHKATSNLAVRQAIATAIDRSQVASVGESGYVPAANQAGIVEPAFDAWLDKDALSSSGYDKPDVAKATQILAGAGYSPSHPLKLTVISISGYSDWDSSIAVITNQLKKIGIDLTTQDLEQQTFLDRLQKGNYDLAYWGEPTGGPSPYYELREMLYSGNTAPIGTAATGGNVERYKNPDVDKLFDSYASSATTQDQQMTIIKQIEASMLKDLPVIPTTASGIWYQYNDSDLKGWPTQSNPYSLPAPWAVPDVEMILLNVYSSKAQS